MHQKNSSLNVVKHAEDLMKAKETWIKKVKKSMTVFGKRNIKELVRMDFFSQTKL